MKKILFACALALGLSACANSSILVERPNASSYRTDSATVVYDKSNVSVDEANIEYTRKKMEDAFFGGDKPIFVQGDGITVKYRYLSFDEGSRAARYLLGPIAGGSKIVLEVEFFDKSGTSLALVRGEGTVAGGFFGGSNKTGIDKAVDEIADYAQTEFHN